MSVDAFEYKQRFAEIVEEMRSAYERDGRGKAFRGFLEKYRETASRDEVYIVIAGEYSTGKSTIISAITGNRKIETDSDVKTQKPVVYDYNGFKLVDTPGLFTEFEEHTRLTKQELKQADAIVYCITAGEQFTPTSRAEFVRLAKESGYADRLILAVNKFEPVRQKNASADPFSALEDSVFETLEGSGLNPAQITMSIFSAKRYIDGVDKGSQDKIDASYFPQFEQLLNDTHYRLQGKCAGQARMLSRFLLDTAQTIREQMSDSEKARLLEEKSRLQKRLGRVETQLIRFTKSRFFRCGEEIIGYIRERKEEVEQGRLEFFLFKALGDVQEEMESELEEFQVDMRELHVSVSFGDITPPRQKGKNGQHKILILKAGGEKLGTKLGNEAGKQISKMATTTADNLNVFQRIQYWILKPKPGGEGTQLFSKLVSRFPNNGGKIASLIANKVPAILSHAGQAVGAAIDLGAIIAENRNEAKRQQEWAHYRAEIYALIREFQEAVEDEIRSRIVECKSEIDKQYSIDFSGAAFQKQIEELMSRVKRISDELGGQGDFS